MFVSWLYSSQPCEQLFRTTRSLTSTFNTAVNFSIKELMNRVKRIEMLNSISNDLGNSKNNEENDIYKFPQNIKQTSMSTSVSRSLSNITSDMLTSLNLNSTINDAFDDCQKLLRTLGIIMQEETMIIDDLVLNISIEKLYKTMGKTINDDCVNSDVNFITSDGDLGENMNDSVNYHVNNITDLNPDEIDNELDLCSLSSIENIGEFLNLKNVETKFDEEAYRGFKNSPFIKIKTNNNKSMIIKKSTLCWLLDNKKDIVSTDCLRRFIPIVSNNDTPLIVRKKITISDHVRIGDWALFRLNKTKDKEINIPKNVKFEGFIICRILAFGYMTKRNKTFGRQFVIIKEDHLNEIACYCSCYTTNESGQLFSFEKKISVSVYEHLYFFNSKSFDKSISNSDDDSLSDSYSVHDSPDTDSLGSDENSDNNGLKDEPQLQTEQNKINMSGIVSLNKENYYAIMYDTNWYLGRLIYFTNQEKTFCEIKFLKTDLDTFYWPKHPEQQEDRFRNTVVKQKHIVEEQENKFGPIINALKNVNTTMKDVAIKTEGDIQKLNVPYYYQPRNPELKQLNSSEETIGTPKHSQKSTTNSPLPKGVIKLDDKDEFETVAKETLDKIIEILEQDEINNTGSELIESIELDKLVEELDTFDEEIFNDKVEDKPISSDVLNKSLRLINLDEFENNPTTNATRQGLRSNRNTIHTEYIQPKLTVKTKKMTGGSEMKPLNAIEAIKLIPDYSGQTEIYPFLNACEVIINTVDADQQPFMLKMIAATKLSDRVFNATRYKEIKIWEDMKKILVEEIYQKLCNAVAIDKTPAEAKILRNNIREQALVSYINGSNDKLKFEVKTKNPTTLEQEMQIAIIAEKNIRTYNDVQEIFRTKNTSSFYQIKLDVKSKELTAFSTNQGHWHFKKMAMGLKTSPSSFQRLMNNVMAGIVGIKCLVYLDDIIIYGKGLLDHNEKLRDVFERLRNHNLKIQPTKCEFLKQQCMYLGHIISENGIQPDPEKIKSVFQFPIPASVKEIKSFLGLSGYYRKFIKSYSLISKPMTNLLRKDVTFNWDTSCQEAFDKLKNILCSEPILQYPDFTKPFIVTTDASGKALGAILSQGEVSQDLPIAYSSRTLSKCEKQSRLIKSIEVAGIPHTPNENCAEIVKEIGLKTNTVINVVEANRQFFNNNSNSIIIAKLETIDMKKTLIRNSKITKISANNICSAWPDKNKIFINERLTKERRSLFGKARAYAKEKNFKFVWVNNGI
ncbi:hypothetical protein QTP88_021341 [Uroleucon formosanum]